MKFIEIIIQNSQIKEAKLYGPSKKASESPETGITIKTPAAFHVIKDCAALANKYLPHFVFGSYANPFEVLKGKFTKQDIIEFVNFGMSDIVANQLLTLILEKIKRSPYAIIEQQVSQIPQTVSNDPYGDYENSVAVESPSVTQNDPVALLCYAFSVQ